MSTPERIRDILGIGTEASPLHQPAVADTAAATLRQEILNGQHFSGEQLREAQLSARLKVSRNSIRQAYRKLEGEGLLFHKPHHGVFVATFDRTRIEQLYAFRRTAECGSLYCLAEPAARDLGVRLKAIVTDDSRILAERNNSFHLEIVAASGSPELLSTAESIQAQLRLCFLSYPHSEDLHARFAADHHAIADQLASGQPTRAADLLHEYLDASFAAVVGALELHDA